MMSWFKKTDLDFWNFIPAPAAFALSPSIPGQGEGSIRWRVDCSANPLDLRPASQVILAAIDQMQAGLGPEQPLVVLMGETHTRPTHHALQRLVIGDLHARGEGFTVGYELQHNFWAKIARDDMGKNVPEALFYRPGPDIDPLGLAGLAAFAGYWEPPMAPLSELAGRAALYDTIADDVRKGKNPPVKFCFNDAARDRGTIDLRDPQTQRALDAVRADGRWKPPMLWKEKPEVLISSTPFGIAVRNEVMKTIALDCAARSGHRLIVQITGKDHCLGNRKDDDLYRDSLDACFRRAGAAVLTVFPTSSKRGIENVPAEAAQAQASALVVDGLGEQDFVSSLGFMDMGEYICMHRIAKATEDRLPLLDILAVRNAWQKTAQHHVKAILAAHRAGKEPYDPVPCL